MTGYARWKELYERDPQYASTQCDTRVLGQAGFTIASVVQPAGEFADPPLGELGLVVNVGDVSRSRVDYGEGWIDATGSVDELHIQPPGESCLFETPGVHLNVLSILPRELDRHLSGVGLGTSSLLRHLPSVGIYPRLTFGIIRVWQVAAQGGVAASLEADAAFLSLVAEMVRHCGLSRAVAPIPAVGDERIGRVLDYVEAYLHRPLFVEELAGIACVSAFHFTRVFKTETGLTPHAYLTQRRVARAQAALLRTDQPASVVALECGFGGQTQMSRSFKRVTGCTPSEWRKTLR